MEKNVLGMLFVLLVCTVGLQAANVKGNGKIVTKTIPVAEYEQIEVGGNINCGGSLFGKKQKSPVFNYSQSTKKAELKVTTDENLFEHLVIGTSAGKLTINTPKGTQISPTNFIIEGRSKGLNHLRLSGCVDFALQTSLSGDDLNLVITGSSDVTMDQPVDLKKCQVTISGSGDWFANYLTCSRLKLAVSGSGDAKLKGKADNAAYAVSGSGDISAYDFAVKNLVCSVSGSGDIKAYAIDAIQASASGSGDIAYKGDPDAKVSTSGSGSVKKTGR